MVVEPLDPKDKFELVNSPSHVATGKSIEDILVPTPNQFLSYIGLAFLVLLLVNADAFLKFFSNKLTGNQQYLGQAFGGGISSMVNYLDDHAGYRLAGFTVWFVLGLVTYWLVWVVKNIVVNVHNDFITEKYIEVPHNKRSTYWKPILFLKFKFFLSFFGGLAYLAIIPRVLPKISDTFYGAITAQNFHELTFILSLIEGFLVIYVAVAFLRLAQHYWVWISHGL